MKTPNALSGMKWFAAILLFVAITGLATVNVSTETHLWLSASAFVIVMLGMNRSDRNMLNLIMLITGALISLRYIWWRYDQTLPWESSIDMPFALALFITEIYGITIYLLGMFVNVRQRERDIVPIDESKPLPVIDVFIPTYNESPRVVRPTISAAMQLRYPGTVNVWVLDDGGTAQKLNDPNLQRANAARQRTNDLKQLCLELGANYLTRPANLNAKAGNINHALKHSSGELILILDADHVPTRDFLVNTVGMFQQQPRLGFLQTPHFFVTPNPIERNLGIENKVPAENEMFYNRILKGMDFWNASFFCGSAAIIRRKALVEAGGISSKTITEDADTAINIHANGWDSAYINKAMIAGLSPDTFGAYVTQRTRWAQGMLQIFMRNNPLLKRGLSLPQKLCYLNSTLFWFFPLFRVIYLLAPLCYLLFDLQIFVGNANDFIAYAIPHLIISMAINQHLFGNSRNAFFSELYETILALFLLLPVLSVLVNPRKPSFTVTPKGETTDHTHFSSLTPVVLALIAIIGTAEAWGIYRIYQYPVEQGQLTVVLVFNTFNLLMCLVCLGAMVEKRQRRFEPRTRCETRASVSINGESSDALIEDASISGARLTIPSLSQPLQPNDVIQLVCLAEQPKSLPQPKSSPQPKFSPQPDTSISPISDNIHGNTAGKSSDKMHLKPHRLTLRVHRVQALATGQTVNCELMDADAKAAQIFTSMTFGHSQRWAKRREFEAQQRKSLPHAFASFCKLAFLGLTQAITSAGNRQDSSGSAAHHDNPTQDVRQ